MMAALLLIAVFMWLAIAFWLSRIVASRLSNTGWRAPITMMLFVALLPLPIIDELVARHQFEKLCEANSTIQVDRAKAVGRKVYLAQSPDVEVNGTWVPIVLKPWRFVDARTGEAVVSYNTVIAGGGRLYKGLTEGGVPLLFKGHCRPGNQYTLATLFKELELTPVDRPVKATGSKGR